MDAADIALSLIRRGSLEAQGLTSPEIRALVDSRTLVRVRRGWYSSGTDAAQAYQEQRHLQHVVAVAQAQRGTSAVFSHISAAALWDLPLFRADTRRVHLTMRSALHSGATSDVVRHRDVLPEGDIALRSGLRCTTLSRTVVDVARLFPTHTAICAIDAALRSIAWDESVLRYDERAAEFFRDELRACVAGMPGKRGVVRARELILIGDGRAQLPGESVSRHHLRLLGFARPRLQVPIPGPRGRDYFVDFGLDDVASWGEFDGKGKYSDPTFLRGRTPERALWDEKQREDWIRGTTGRPVIRWGMEHLATPSEFERRLRAFGIIAPYRRGVVVGEGWSSPHPREIA